MNIVYDAGEMSFVVRRRKISNRVEEEHGILTYNGGMILLPHFHFQFKSANISTISTSIPKTCVYIWRLFS